MMVERILSPSTVLRLCFQLEKKVGTILTTKINSKIMDKYLSSLSVSTFIF